jgi:hypothetical protein
MADWAAYVAGQDAASVNVLPFGKRGRDQGEAAS